MGAAEEAEDAADEAAAFAARFSGHDTRAAVPPLASRGGSLETGTTGGGSVIQRLKGCALARRWATGDGRRAMEMGDERWAEPRCVSADAVWWCCGWLVEDRGYDGTK